MEKYSLVQRLGQGSFAVVWKARRKSDGRLVAVKQLRQSPESWEACKQLPEVRAAAAISDRRHVVLLLEAVRHGGELFLVFEYVESSLHACAALGQRIEEPQVRWAGRRLLAALAAVHAAGLVHCDVKPENILVGTEGGNGGAPTMKLCDFGQATPPGLLKTYVGTRWYRAPELLLDARGDTAVDLWAAGCTLAELFLRRPLVPGTDCRDMLFRICGELGAPDEDDPWPLAAKMVEVSGRANAEAAAWTSLAEAGASEAGVALLAALLRYDGSKRIKAERALREAPFFTDGAFEAPMALPPARPVSPETLRRHRDEAGAVEKRILASGGGATAAANGIRGGEATPTRVPRARLSGGGYNDRPPVPAGAASSTLPVPSRGRLSAAAPAATGVNAERQRRLASAERDPAVANLGSAEVSSPGSPWVGSGRSGPSRAAGAGNAGDSDDEALAEAFWGACKAGGGTPARSPDGEDSAEDEALKFVTEVSERGRARRRRPDAGLAGRSPRPTTPLQKDGSAGGAGGTGCRGDGVQRPG